MTTSEEVTLAHPKVKRAWDEIARGQEKLVELVTSVTETPAPSHEEDRRTQLVAKLFEEAGLTNVRIDESKTPLGELNLEGEGPTILLAAHIDTVFPMDTPIRVVRDDDFLRAPGVGDNSSSVAALCFLARLLVTTGLLKELGLGGRLIFAGTSGEEGLGDLKGMKQVMKDLESSVDLCLPVDGRLGGLIYKAVGSRRLRITALADGGHSWGAFGTPSAIHALGRLIARIDSIQVPEEPRTTYNVGVISGGTSVNTIAAGAELLLDLRSVDPEQLATLEGQVRSAVAAVGQISKVRFEVEVIGDRPAGEGDGTRPIAGLIRDIYSEMGISCIEGASSTDGNVPISMGIPSFTIGVYRGGNGHRQDEWIDSASLIPGLQSLLLIVLGALQIEGVATNGN